MDTDLITWLSERLDRLESKLDDGSNKLANIDVTLARQAKDLETHTARIAALEEVVAPIEAHVEKVRGIMWFAGVVVALIGAVATVKGLL